MLVYANAEVLSTKRHKVYSLSLHNLMLHRRKKDAPCASFLHSILSCAEVCGLNLLVCKQLLAGAGHCESAGFENVADMRGLESHIRILLD